MSGSSDETDIVFSPDAGPGVDANTDTAADTGRTLDPSAEPVESTLSTADQATLEALRPGSALLLVQHGPNAGARFLLDAELTTVGRHPGNDIFLDDVTVSRKHAQFRRGAEGFSVRDVGSLNGTYVRRERIDGEVALHTGDQVQVGKFRFLYHDSSPAPRATDGGGGS